MSMTARCKCYQFYQLHELFTSQHAINGYNKLFFLAFVTASCSEFICYTVRGKLSFIVRSVSVESPPNCYFRRSLRVPRRSPKEEHWGLVAQDIKAGCLSCHPTNSVETLKEVTI